MDSQIIVEAIMAKSYLPKLMLGNSEYMVLKLSLKVALLTMEVSSSSSELARDGMVASEGLDRAGI